MGIAVIFYLISFGMFISSGIRAYASKIEYKRTGTRKTNYGYSIRFIISIVCMIIGTFITTHLY